MRTDPTVLPETPLVVQHRFALQPARVRRALAVGLLAREPDFHMFVSAAPEASIEDDVLAAVRLEAATRPAPPDLLYVGDPTCPEAPRAIEVPAGRGAEIAERISGLVQATARRVAELSRDSGVRGAERALAKELSERTKEPLAGLEAQAKQLGFGVRAIPGGIQTFPILHGKPVSPEQFAALDEGTQKQLEEAEESLSAAVEAAAAKIRAMTEEVEAAHGSALGEAAARAVLEEIAELEASLDDAPEARAHVAHVGAWLAGLAREPGFAEQAEKPDLAPGLAARVVRAHDPEGGAPVVHLVGASPPRLFGGVTRRVQGGVLVADVDSIRAGALARASGGFLVVRAADVVSDATTWDRLKRALREQAHELDDGTGPLTPLAPTFRPCPVPFRTRVVLIGSEDLYAALASQDPDFLHLFRVKVEVEDDVPRTPDAIALLDGWLAERCKLRGFLPADRRARARLLDLSTRTAADREHLSMAMAPLEETLAFASVDARERGQDHVDVDAIDRAWNERRDRTSATALAIRDQILRGEILLDTTGKRVGVVNGLAVIAVGDLPFGQPMRLTAVVSIGTEGIVDVEREAQLGGSVHTKGVAIVRGFLSLLFGQERPLSLRAQITFEQSYGEIDGDSASSSELFAVLSALSEVPVDQQIAVTGSVNQLGEMQPIGGACAKIEAFHDLCAARGLTGSQGVLLPLANARHLVLRDDVALAIEKGTFHVWGVKDVWEGIEILCNIPAGTRDADGRFPASSVFGRVERRLIELAERLRDQGGGPDAGVADEGPGDEPPRGLSDLRR